MFAEPMGLENTTLGCKASQCVLQTDGIARGPGTTQYEHRISGTQFVDLRSDVNRPAERDNQEQHDSSDRR